MFTKLTQKSDSFIEMGIPGYDCTVYHKGECVCRRFNGHSEFEATDKTIIQEILR